MDCTLERFAARDREQAGFFVSVNQRPAWLAADLGEQQIPHFGERGGIRKTPRTGAGPGVEFSLCEPAFYVVHLVHEVYVPPFARTYQNA